MEWIELDPWGRTTGKPFAGSHEALIHHLAGLTRDGRITTTVERVLLCRVDDYIIHRVNCTLVVMRTPWSFSRWIPRPHQSKSRKESA